ncbi:MAG: LON peptidase substrate-binding domain-containing protein [Alphaproteobacteria bacterium]|nr:LON peptidase substrate-binding domain-containing protein [Alphaproteobacteria bacterium]
MSNSIFDVTMVELPSNLPILPFSGIFLFPETKVNLRIYEMRYIRLVFNALASSRMIGMVQPTEQDMSMKVPALYKTGCAGRISGFTESDDTLLITLTGISRFNIVKEMDHSGIYRDAAIDFSPFTEDFNLDDFKFNKKELFAKVDFYAYSNKIDLTSDMLRQMPQEQILMTLAMLLPFTAAEKQALLECEKLQKFYETLLLLLDMNSKERIN